MNEAENKYNDPIVITFPNMVARVYSPILESGDRKKRMKAIHRATVNIGKIKKEN